MGKKIIKILFCMLFLTVATNAKAEVKTVKHSTKNVYTTKYQREATKQLKKWKKTTRTINKPLLVKNPYGTMSTSIYYYALSKEQYSVKCTLAASVTEAVMITFAGGKAFTKH